MAEVERVAREYLHAEQFTLLVVGNPDDFDRPLSSFGEVSEIDISIPNPPTTRPEGERPAQAAAGGPMRARRGTSSRGSESYSS